MSTASTPGSRRCGRRRERAQREGYRLARARTPGSLVERDAMVYHAARRLRALDAEYEGLVFGRLDLGDRRGPPHRTARPARRRLRAAGHRLAGAGRRRRSTRRRRRSRWSVVRRRVIQCQGPEVLDVEDDLLDGRRRAPTRSPWSATAPCWPRWPGPRATRMRDIVATIQREQDEAIRAPAGGVTLIEGGPGTGKTAVALHRAAHLLYRDRRRFEGAGVLLVGPSPVFMSYVERVLPSLGEETAELRSLGRDRRRRQHRPARPAGPGRAQGLAADAPVPAAGPAGAAAGRADRAAHRVRGRGAPAPRGTTWTGCGASCTSGCTTRTRPAPRCAAASCRRCGRVRPEGVSWTTKAFADELYDRDEFERFARAWWPMLRPDRRARLARRRSPGCATPARTGSRRADAAALAGSWAGRRRVDLSVADVALVDELRVLLGEPPRPSRRRSRSRGQGIDFAGDDIRELSTVTDRYYSRPERAPRPDNYDGYAHVLVDEAQDVSPMQWRMLGRRGGQASWTIVGDAAQSAWPDLPEALRARDEALRGKQVRRFHLRHQLPQLGRDLRVRGRRGDAGRCPTPTCRTPCAGPALEPEHRLSPADALPGRGRRRRSPTCSPRSTARSA